MKFGIKNEEVCLYCGQNDSIEHTFIECTFTRTFTSNVGLTQPTRVGCPQQQKKYCLAFLATVTIRK